MDEFNDDYSRDLSILAKVEELGNKVSQCQSELEAIEAHQRTLRLGSPEWKKVEKARIIAAAKLLHYQLAWFQVGEERGQVGVEYNNEPLTAQSPPEDFIKREIELSEKRHGIRVMDANSLPFGTVHETPNDSSMSNKTGCMISVIILVTVFGLGIMAASC